MIGARATRRRFFSFMGVAPLAGKQAAEHAARGLAGIGSHGIFPTIHLRSSLGMGDANANTPATVSAQTGGNWSVVKQARDAILRKALETKESRAELEAILYEDMRVIHSFDPDLAANRSYSLAAKVCYQRQRNVQRAIEASVMEQSGWARINEWRDRLLSVAGIKF